MRFSTVVVLSTLSLGVTAAAIPLPQPVGETSVKSVQIARDVDALEGRSVKKVVFGAIAAATIYHFWNKHKKNQAAKAANNAPVEPAGEPTPEARELLEDDFEARDLQEYYTRALDALERRGVGKVLLGAAAGALLVHEVEKHSHPSEKEAELEERDLYEYDARDLDALERRSVGKVLLGAAVGALLVHEVEKHSHHAEKEAELEERDFYQYDARDLDILEGRSVGKALLAAGAGALLVHEVDKHFHPSDKVSQENTLERRRLPLVL
jgi:hypothetical protein